MQSADRLCQDTDVKLKRTGDRINAAAKAVAAAPRSDRKRFHLRSRRAWLDQHKVLAEDFARLRELKKVGADSQYDTFLAAWAQMLRPTQAVAEGTGKDRKTLEENYAWLQRSVEAMGNAADNASLTACAKLFTE